MGDNKGFNYYITEIYTPINRLISLLQVNSKLKSTHPIYDIQFLNGFWGQRCLSKWYWGKLPDGIRSKFYEVEILNADDLNMLKEEDEIEDLGDALETGEYPDEIGESSEDN